MKKTLILAALLITVLAAYLVYDWHIKTNQRKTDPGIPLYTWTDKGGAIHYTDTEPPPGAKNVKVTRGVNYYEPPLFFIIRDKTVELFEGVSKKIKDYFNSRSKKKKK